MTPSSAPEPTGSPRLIQVTQPEDGPFHPRMYSYWANAWVTGDHAFVFAGHVDDRARFFDVHLPTGLVARLGSLVAIPGTTEGWFWNKDGRITLCAGPRLVRVNPFIVSDPGEILLDISESHPGCNLWQAHSDDSGTVHSATVACPTTDGPDQRLGTILSVRGDVRPLFDAHGILDESQITRDGAYLVIKENDDNRIVTVATGEERIIPDAAGAVGHSDTGDSIVIGEDNHLGACVLWDLATLTKRPLFSTWNLGHLSVRGGRCLVSGGRPEDYAEEGWLYLLDLNSGGLTPLLNPGGGTSYDDKVKSSLDPSGMVATYMANGAVYLLVLP